MKSSRAGMALIAAALALVVGSCGGGGVEAPQLAGYVRTPLPDVGSLTLPDASNGGAPFAMKASPGGLLLMYFGYTSCPDVCPTTMAEMRKAIAQLGDDGARIEVAMATVDPNRDTDEVITAYVHTFAPEGHGLRTEVAADLQTVADAFGAVYSVTEDEDGAIEVVHTAHQYAIDADGLIRVTWPFGTSADDMASDMEILLEQVP